MKEYVNGCMHEQMNEYMNGCMHEKMKEYRDEWKYMNG